MNYSLTFASLIVAVLGWLGVSHIATQSEVATVIGNLLQIGGMLVAFYGRYRAGGVTKLGVKE